MQRSVFQSIPKVELHTHLEGTITPQTFHELAKKNESESIFANSFEECQKLYQFQDFEGFLNSFFKVTKAIREVSDLDIILKHTVETSKKEHYRYVEYFISIDTFLKKGMSLIEILDRLHSLQKQYSTKEYKIGGFIIDFVRNYGPDNATLLMEDLLQILDDYRDTILGISIGGDELHYPAPVFKPLFDKARSLGLKTTAHAGEAAGPESVWDTILNLKTDRIGHGLCVHESSDLIKHFRVTQTHLEICPTSNFKTGLITSLNVHPVQKYLVAGLNFSINTDDSGFFNTSLSSEFEICKELFSFEDSDFKQIILNAARGCFLDTLEQKELLYDLQFQLDKIFY